MQWWQVIKTCPYQTSRPRGPSDPRIHVVGQAIRQATIETRVAALPTPGALLRSLRPRQWTKNGFLFVALAFTLNLQEPFLVVRTVAAFACFCALSSAGYLLNDILDVEADRAHPTKRLRPIAAGQVRVGFAFGLALVLAVGGLTERSSVACCWVCWRWRTSC